MPHARFDLDYPTDSAFLNQLGRLVHASVPCHRPVHHKPGSIAPDAANHSQTIRQADSHRLFNAYVCTARCAGFRDFRMAGIFTGNNAKVWLFIFQHVQIIVVRLYPKAINSKLSVPGTSVRCADFDLRSCRHRIRTSTQIDLRVIVKMCGNVVNMHMGEADNGYLITIHYVFLPFSA